MERRRGAGVATCAAVLSVGLAGCIAPDVEVVGALGVTVDDEAQPVIVVEACDGAAVRVSMSFDREGLAADEENEEVGEWTASPPVPGTSQLALTSPEGPWQGSAVDLPVERGFIATGEGEGDTDVLSQVAFRGADLDDLEPGMVYSNDPDPDVRTLIARTPADFTAEMCSREG